MVERLSNFFHKNNQIFTRSWLLDWMGRFARGVKWDAPSSFGLWAKPLEASHYGRPSREAVGVYGQRFGLWTWPLQASRYVWPKAPIPRFYWLFFSTHLCGLLTKFGLSIPQPLDLDGHSAKQPQ
jgi:hypothetical protein